jgi:hypothetical protein
VTKAVAKKAVPVKQTVERANVIERVGMKRWLRLTARKHSVGKPTTNLAAGAAAEALAKMLAESKKLA